MRDFVAIVIVFLLVAFALRMATSLHWYRRSNTSVRRALEASGQSIVAEIPGGDGLRFFTEDDTAFHWGDRAIPKDRVKASRVLISGAPISVCVSRRLSDPDHASGLSNPLAATPTQPDGIERDRWDVAIDIDDETVLVECGAIRERVSQELARQVFDAVRADIEHRDRS